MPFPGFTRKMFEEKCNSCLLYPSLLLSVRYNVYEKKLGSNSDAIKEVSSKGQNV